TPAASTTGSGACPAPNARDAMFGAVFRQELMLAGRRDRLHQLRWAWAGLLLVQYLPAVNTAARLRSAGLRVESSAADNAFQFLAGEQLVLLLILAPFFTATAFTEEKARGTLLPLLATQLTPAGIVLDKFAARLAQLLLLGLTGVPVLAVAAGFAPRPAPSLAAVAVATFVPVVAVAAAGMLASVWCRSSGEALIATSLLGPAILCLLPYVRALEAMNPFPLLALPEQVVAGVDPTDVLLLDL